MSLRVVKFGGSSVGDVDRIKSAARIVKNIIDDGDDVIVVVSAMSGTTNKILSLCNEISDNDSTSRAVEFDAALSTGESLSAALFALALSGIGIKSKSLQSWQVPIISNSLPNNALIEDIDTKYLLELISLKVVPVIAGFQAITSENIITTLGRGGSDTSAAAIAAALSADYCDIYTDVEGVYSADPRIVHDAKIIPKLSYEEMVEFAGAGAKVLHPRSVEICMRYGINLRILSSFNLKSGTEIMNSVSEINKITGISYIKNLSIIDVFCDQKDLADFLEEFSKEAGNIYQIVSCESDKLKFILSGEYLPKISKILKNRSMEHNIINSIGSVKIVGAGIRHDLKIFSDVLSILNKNNIKYYGFSNSEVKLSIFIDEYEVERLVKILHGAFLNV
jgi:aspartate kinase